MTAYEKYWANPLELSVKNLKDPAQIAALAQSGNRLQLDRESKQNLELAHTRLYKVLLQGGSYYGINTGVGDLARVELAPNQRSRFSENLIKSHACGWGQGLGKLPSRAILACAINQWCHGHSGIQPELVNRFLTLFNSNIDPWMPMGGSLDYSLVPMAHAGLLLLGKGKAHFQNRLISGKKVLQVLNQKPVQLGAKDGLSIISGTAAPLGLSSLAWQKLRETLKWAQWIGGLSFEVLGGNQDCLHPEIHRIRKQPGQLSCSTEMLRLLEGGSLELSNRSGHVQDCTSLRAIPQVHGACDDVIQSVRLTLQRELASSTDNPQIIRDRGVDKIISGYNPSCQALAFSLEQVAHVLVEIANLSERRVDRLLTPHFSGYPAFLTPHPGMNSGLMIPHYACAGTLARLRLLATPMVVQNFVTTGGQEDHTSLATASAARVLEMIPEVQRILSIELLCAAQAVEFTRDGSGQISFANQLLHQEVRKRVPKLKHDRELHHDLDMVYAILNTREILAKAVDLGLGDCFELTEKSHA